ncbi:MAG: ABC transporter ATP-binding protein [Fuerstiella sp.]|nr:ABC transporter ATP-binding protein [Fuerstiella sp.]
MAPLLEVSDLRRCFGSVIAVDGVSFEVSAGEVFGLLGPNGAGKSTTMMMLCGLLPMTSGHVILDGRSVTEDSRQVRQMLGFVPQDLAIYPELSAEENLSFFGSLYNLSGKLLKQRIDETIEQVGLSTRRKDLAETFSGGMKRRLNFAAAVLHRPRLLILDEPTVGVDPQSRTHLLDCIRTVQQQGTAVIYASHYMDEVQAICSQVAVMDHGKILTCDTLSRLIAGIPYEIELVVPVNTTTEELNLPASTTVSVTESGLSIRLTERQSSRRSLNRRLAQLITQLSDQDIPLLHIRTHESSLERLFLELTGSQLRD